MNEAAVQEAVTTLQLLVEGDGAQIEITQLDCLTASVHLRLDLTDVECLDCVMPPEFLVDIIEKRIRGADPTVNTVTVADPRNSPIS